MPVEVSGNAIAALQQVASGGVYSPTDASDGDPGGATAGSGTDTSGVQAAAATFLANRDDASLQALLAAWPTPPTTGVDNLNVASGQVIACHKSVYAATLIHTHKEAIAVGMVHCSASVSISDTFDWFSTDTGVFFDGSTGHTTELRASFLDGSSTTGGRRGHRDIRFCTAEATQDGSAVSGGCVIPTVLPGRGV